MMVSPKFSLRVIEEIDNGAGGGQDSIEPLILDVVAYRLQSIDGPAMNLFKKGTCQNGRHNPIKAREVQKKSRVFASVGARQATYPLY